MLVLIDESGDCGLKFDKGSSEFFTCIAVLFRDGMAADACDRSIDGLRYQLKKPRTYEFHFSHCSDRIRRAFLETVSQEDFRYAGFVLEKRKLYGNRFTNPKELYEFAVTLACDHLKLHLENAKVIIDKNGDREFKKRLERSLTANMVDAEGNCRLRKVTMEASHTNNLVQLADMICGAVGRSFTGHNDAFRALVKRHEKIVQLWPQS